MSVCMSVSVSMFRSLGSSVHGPRLPTADSCLLVLLTAGVLAEASAAASAPAGRAAPGSLAR
eukprot:6037495-Alexandrium_andersonii.AAC.1